jgi:tungstate transport system ATP-binding protein
MLPIVLENLSFRAGGRIVLDGVSATITPSGVTAIVGPNGAGKSVLLRLIDGLLRPDGGIIRFGDRPAEMVHRALVFQRPGLIRASVARNVALALAPLGLSRRVAEARVVAALERVGLKDRAQDAARKLSGGEQQRLALARAWVVEPELLLLDEPTANLDPAATEEVERLITDMADAGTKIILVSHNLGQVARIAAEVMILSHGRIVEQGPAKRTLMTPRTPEARAYINRELPWTSLAHASYSNGPKSGSHFSEESVAISEG